MNAVVPAPLMADAALPREGGADRKVVDVAVGVLIAADGRFLLTTRPPGKVYAGYWEFPGGKLEVGETVALALRRELRDGGLSPCLGAAAFLQGLRVDGCAGDA
jgi:ADP-ribose pyrophosphatase YjhB (NUDIX family)